MKVLRQPRDDQQRRAREHITERYGPRDIQRIIDAETWDDFADWLALGFANADADADAERGHEVGSTRNPSDDGSGT